MKYLVKAYYCGEKFGIFSTVKNEFIVFGEVVALKQYCNELNELGL